MLKNQFFPRYYYGVLDILKSEMNDNARQIPNYDTQ